MKHLITWAALAAALLIAAPLRAQTYTEQIEQTVDQQKRMVKDAEDSKKAIEKRCEREIDRLQSAVKRCESQIDEAKAAKKTGLTTLT